MIMYPILDPSTIDIAGGIGAPPGKWPSRSDWEVRQERRRTASELAGGCVECGLDLRWLAPTPAWGPILELQRVQTAETKGFTWFLEEKIRVLRECLHLTADNESFLNENPLTRDLLDLVMRVEVLDILDTGQNDEMWREYQISISSPTVEMRMFRRLVETEQLLIIHDSDQDLVSSSWDEEDSDDDEAENGD